MLRTILLIVLIGFILPEQSINDELIYWRENYKLKWEDFKGEPDPTVITYDNQSPAAASLISIYVEEAKTSEYVCYEILARFNVTKSFTTTDQNDLLLRHEQLHFDIAELYGRILKKAILELNDCSNVDAEFDNLYEGVLLKEGSVNKAYDYDTFSGRIEPEQKQWEINIKQMLDSLDAYKDIRVCIDLQKCEVYTEESRFTE